MTFTEADIKKVFDSLVDLAHKIHKLVGDIMAVVGEECALCDEMHTLAE
jgi:hypothetical protein